MIKRIRFATRPAAAAAGGTAAGDFAAAWRAAVAGALAAPPDARPVRVAVCTALPELTPDPRHDGIGLEWFTDAGHLARFESWLSSPAGRLVDELLARAVDPAASPVVVAREHVMRGADWLERRWRDGGERLKHMAIARRAAGLTPAEFSERWRGRAGRVGAVVIPESARGQAYLQNHPLPRSSGEWAYDALNEVYVDGLDGMRARIAWFAENLDGRGEADLVGQSWFVAAREEVL